MRHLRSRSRYYGRSAIGQTRVLNLHVPAGGYNWSSPSAPVRASAPTPTPSPGFWQNASTTEKGVIVVGTVGAAVLLWLAFK